MTWQTPLLSATNIQKSFGAHQLKACDEITFDLFPGEIHAIVGENGAGKTTLMRILAGLLAQDQGEIRLRGHILPQGKPFLKQGVALMQQHPAWSPDLFLWEHALLGSEKTFFINPQKTLVQLKDFARTWGFDLPWQEKCSQVSHSVLQKATLLAFLRFPLQVLLMDEPTTTLPSHEAHHILHLIKKISSGTDSKAVLFITHKLDEVLRVCDRISIMSSGKLILTSPTTEMNLDKLSLLMHKKKISFEKVQKTELAKSSQEPLFEAIEITVEKFGQNVLDHLSFKIFPGEIVGLVSSTNEGIEALEEVLSGMKKYSQGHLIFKGCALDPHGIAQRRKLGMAYVPSNRLGRGSSLLFSLSGNLIPYRLQELSHHGFLRKKRMKNFFDRLKSQFGFQGKFDQKLFTLSGGNIQKLILARELEKEPSLLLVVHSSWGLDMSAQKALYQSFQQLAQKGTAILLLSNEVEELSTICSRIGIIDLKGQLKMTQATSLKQSHRNNFPDASY